MTALCAAKLCAKEQSFLWYVLAVYSACLIDLINAM